MVEPRDNNVLSSSAQESNEASNEASNESSNEVPIAEESKDQATSMLLLPSDQSLLNRAQ